MNRIYNFKPLTKNQVVDVLNEQYNVNEELVRENTKVHIEFTRLKAEYNKLDQQLASIKQHYIDLLKDEINKMIDERVQEKLRLVECHNYYDSDRSDTTYELKYNNVDIESEYHSDASGWV